MAASFLSSVSLSPLRPFSAHLSIGCDHLFLALRSVFNAPILYPCFTAAAGGPCTTVPARLPCFFTTTCVLPFHCPLAPCLSNFCSLYLAFYFFFYGFHNSRPHAFHSPVRPLPWSIYSLPVCRYPSVLPFLDASHPFLGAIQRGWRERWKRAPRSKQVLGLNRRRTPGEVGDVLSFVAHSGVWSCP